MFTCSARSSTGSSPAGRRSRTGAAALKQILVDPPIPPSRLAPGTPPELERIALRALEKDAARRHPTAEAFAAEVEGFGRVAAPRRRGWVAAVAVASVLGGVVGGALARAPRARPREARGRGPRRQRRRLGDRLPGRPGPAGRTAAGDRGGEARRPGTERAALLDRALDRDLAAILRLDERAARDAFEILTKAALETLGDPGLSTENARAAKLRLFRARLLRPEEPIPGAFEPLKAAHVAWPETVPAGCINCRDYANAGAIFFLEDSIEELKGDAAVDHDGLMTLAIANAGHGRVLVLIGSAAEALGRLDEAEALYEIGSKVPGLADRWQG